LQDVVQKDYKKLTLAYTNGRLELHQEENFIQDLSKAVSWGYSADYAYKSSESWVLFPNWRNPLNKGSRRVMKFQCQLQF